MTELSTQAKGQCVAIIAAGGGIGRAFVETLLADEAVGQVLAFSRTAPADHPKLTSFYVDLAEESSIELLGEKLKQMAEGVCIDKVVICSGLLHQGELRPEKSLRQIKTDNLQALYYMNAIVPMLVAQQLVPFLNKQQPTVFAALTARVGSISDNGLGGWYGYRASKSAAHMLLKTLSIELKRKLPKLAVISLHPGTVDTSLSAPFQARVPTGKLFSPHQSAGYLWQVVQQVSAEDSGKIFAWDGSEITP